jgi:hypothetical protein
MRNYNARTILILSTILLALTISTIAGLAQSSSGGPYKITSSVQASGGGTSSASGNISIEGTAGQSAAGGPHNNSPLSHDAGFWPTTSGQATPTPTPQGPSTLQFSQSSFSVQEDLTAATIIVTRTGDASGPASVDYATADNTGNQKGDYEIAAGTITFAPGETTRSFLVLINEDSYVEGTEQVNLLLANPAGASLGSQTTAVLNINDDAVEKPANPNDKAGNFVYQQYHDFLNREPDTGGLAYWTSQITQCGNDQNCISTQRKNVSAAFYIELEFQETGYFVYRIQKASFGAPPDYLHFMADRRRVDGANLEPAKQAFASGWVERAAFKAAYPDSFTADQFVNKLFDTAGLSGHAAERAQEIQGLLSGTRTRAEVLRDIIETQEFKTREYNPAFVLMQYFGYLRRDADSTGYQFWLNIINNQLPNDQSGYHAMVCAFITSDEYQDRFGAIHIHANSECGQ